VSRLATVLVVDDDADIRETMTILLEAEGYRALPAADGREALEQLHARDDVGLILVDLRMPRLSGTDFVKALRADPRLARIPVVVMSGDNEAGAMALSLGANGCLAKPVELESLLRTVGRFTH
jgi:CheY-like chemotaxis protein